MASKSSSMRVPSAPFASSGASVSERGELPRAESGRRAFGGGRRQCAAAADFVEQIGRDAIRRIERQSGAKRANRFVELALLEMAATKARPRSCLFRIERDDLRIDTDRLGAEVCELRELEGVALEVGEGGRHSVGILRID